MAGRPSLPFRLPPQDGRSTGRKPDGGSQWYAFTDPTPGTPNGSDGTEANLHLNEVHYSEEGRIDWLEWINLGMTCRTCLNGV